MKNQTEERSKLKKHNERVIVATGISSAVGGLTLILIPALCGFTFTAIATGFNLINVNINIIYRLIENKIKENKLLKDGDLLLSIQEGINECAALEANNNDNTPTPFDRDKMNNRKYDRIQYLINMRDKYRRITYGTKEVSYFDDRDEELVKKLTK
jgi:hypothetical protein